MDGAHPEWTVLEQKQNRKAWARGKPTVGRVMQLDTLVNLVQRVEVAVQQRAWAQVRFRSAQVITWSHSINFRCPCLPSKLFPLHVQVLARSEWSYNPSCIQRAPAGTVASIGAQLLNHGSRERRAPQVPHGAFLRASSVPAAAAVPFFSARKTAPRDVLQLRARVTVLTCSSAKPVPHSRRPTKPWREPGTIPSLCKVWTASDHETFLDSRHCDVCGQVATGSSDRGVAKKHSLEWTSWDIWWSMNSYWVDTCIDTRHGEQKAR